MKMKSSNILRNQARDIKYITRRDIALPFDYFYYDKKLINEKKKNTTAVLKMTYKWILSCIICYRVLKILL